MRVLGAVLLSAALSTGASIPLQAQQHATDRGSFMIGGSAGVSSQKISGASWTTFGSINPHIQYFLAPGLALGGSVSLTHSFDDTTSSTSYGVGPSISYFFGRGDRAVLPYVSTRANVSRLVGEDTGITGYGGTAGLMYMLTSSVGLNTSLFYDVMKMDGQSSNHHVGLGMGVSAFVF